MIRLALALALALAAGLAACGLKGPLERPDPMFGQRGQAELDDPLDPTIEQDDDQRMVFPDLIEEDPFEDLLTDEERDAS